MGKARRPESGNRRAHSGRAGRKESIGPSRASPGGDVEGSALLQMHGNLGNSDDMRPKLSAPLPKGPTYGVGAFLGMLA